MRIQEVRSREYYQGWKAREENGFDMQSPPCPYESEPQRTEWLRGWSGANLTAQGFIKF